VDETRAVFRGHVHWMAAVQDRVQNQDEHGECYRQRLLRFSIFDNDITFAFYYLQLVVITGWTVSSAVLCSLIFGLHQMDLHPIAAAAYSSLSHTLWALCLSWTVIACATGHGGKSYTTSNARMQHTHTVRRFLNSNNYCSQRLNVSFNTINTCSLHYLYTTENIFNRYLPIIIINCITYICNNDVIISSTGYINKLLSCKILIPFSRTTYCAYLVHPIIIRYVVMKRDTPLHLTVETVVRTQYIIIIHTLLTIYYN